MPVPSRYFVFPHVSVSARPSRHPSLLQLSARNPTCAFRPPAIATPISPPFPCFSSAHPSRPSPPLRPCSPTADRSARPVPAAPAPALPPASAPPRPSRPASPLARLCDAQLPTVVFMVPNAPDARFLGGSHHSFTLLSRSGIPCTAGWQFGPSTPAAPILRRCEYASRRGCDLELGLRLQIASTMFPSCMLTYTAQHLRAPPQTPCLRPCPPRSASLLRPRIRLGTLIPSSLALRPLRARNPPCLFLLSTASRLSRLSPTPVSACIGRPCTPAPRVHIPMRPLLASSLCAYPAPRPLPVCCHPSAVPSPSAHAIHPQPRIESLAGLRKLGMEPLVSGKRGGIRSLYDQWVIRDRLRRSASNTLWTYLLEDTGIKAMIRDGDDIPENLFDGGESTSLCGSRSRTLLGFRLPKGFFIENAVLLCSSSMFHRGGGTDGSSITFDDLVSDLIPYKPRRVIDHLAVCKIHPAPV
ncbi:hypothetical protein B0H14DRAFT_3441944 [Mycena olivaceomarginata]|nr:hypothetical protein B0H14DRAFT_3441944 [Mycena olivaceomarginata]